MTLSGALTGSPGQGRKRNFSFRAGSQAGVQYPARCARITGSAAEDSVRPSGHPGRSAVAKQKKSPAPKTPSPAPAPAPPNVPDAERAGLTPWTILQAAIKAVPALKYALAVLGIASAIAIIKGFGIDFRCFAPVGLWRAPVPSAEHDRGRFSNFADGSPHAVSDDVPDRSTGRLSPLPQIHVPRQLGAARPSPARRRPWAVPRRFPPYRRCPGSASSLRFRLPCLA
jgi:hypothetical protein